MAAFEFAYKPDGASLLAFMRSDAFARGIRGPIGSGKSVVCCVEALRRAVQQAPSPKDQIRRTRGAVIRNTGPELKTTTIKTWLDWFPEKIFGKFRWDPPFTHRIRFRDVEMEVIFLALDKPQDVSKLLSLELTWVWINEAREVPKAVVDAASSRVDRYPSKRDGGATWAGMWMDTNAPDETHWWPIMAGDVPLPDWITPDQALTLVRPPNWQFFAQPPGMLESKNPEGRVLGYVPNPMAENAKNLSPIYYPNLIQGKQKSWIDVYVMNRLGSITEGRPVYPTFVRETHVAREPIRLIEAAPIRVGIDFGLSPAAIFAQRTARGRWFILAELIGIDMGAKRFAEAFKRFVQDRFPDHTIEMPWGDPAGDHRAQSDEETPFRILRAAGVPARPAPTNDPTIRQETVASLLDKMVDGAPALLIDPACQVLITGFEHGYHRKRLNVAGMEKYEDEAEKNRFSHPHDALQYLVVGGGEGRALISKLGNKQAVPTVARRDWNVFDRQSTTRERKGKQWTARRGY